MKRAITLTILILLTFFSSNTESQYYFNRAFSLPGVAGNYVVTDPGANLSITGSFTVEFWMKPNNTTGAQILVQKRLGSAAAGYTVYISSGRIAIRTNSSTRMTATTILPTDRWSHVAATYNSTTNVFTVYLNGVSDGTATVAGAAPAADSDSLRIGAGFNSPYNGFIDEIRVWNVERTVAEVNATRYMPLGEAGGQYPGLVASWRANNVAGGSGVEEVNGYTAYLRGTAAYVLVGDKAGGYTAFNTGIFCTGAATGTCVSVPSASQLNPATAMTLECWVWHNNASVQAIFGKGSANYPYRVVKSTGNSFRVFINGTAPGSGNYGGIIPNSKWTHLAFTFNSTTGAFAYYMNGVQTQSGTQSLTIPSNAEALSIGGGPSIVTYNGMIDEVRIANYVKTPEEIQKGMYISIDANNEPNPGNTNVAYSFEGTLDGTDGAPSGTWAGTGIIRFTQVVNNSSEPPILTDRHDAGNFPGGYRYHYADLAFGSAPTTVLDSIFMPQNLTISDVNLFVGIHHAYANDVSLSLRNPAGSTTRILYPGGGPDIGQNMITIFDDQADSTANANLRAPWSPRVKPTNALSIFNSQNSLGYWRLSVTDIFPSSDNGVLVAWGIQFNNLNVTANEQQSSQIPFKFALHQNYPNPFNPTTSIKYDIPKEANVKVVIYDILGKEVMTLVNENKKGGSYTILFNAGGLASGVYFYNIEAGDFNDTKKMMLIK